MEFSLGIANHTIADILVDDSNLTANVNQSTHMDGVPFTLTEAYLLAEYGPKRDPLYIVIPITFVYMLIFVTGVVGNISTCIVISKNKSMHTATNYYLFSLAISDFLLLISGVPQEVYSIWSRYPYVFGELFCVVRGLMAETASNATVLTITSFTVERYLAICHPFLQHTMSKLSRAVKLIIGVWIVSISLAVPQALQFGVITDQNNIEQCTLKRIIFEHSFELSTLLFFLTPMTLITVLYILIGLKLRTSGMMKRENGGTSMQRRVHVNSCHRQQASAGTRRVLKMLVAVVVAFFLCWAPFHAQRLLASYARNNQYFVVYVITTYASGILYYLSTCINPLLYNIMSNKFREAFKETLANFCQLSARSSDEKRTYRILSRSQRRWHSNQESGNYSGSSFRDESVHSAVTQKQSFDSITLSRCQSFKTQPSNQLKLKSNFQRNNSGSLIEYQQQSTVDLSIDPIDDEPINSLMNPMKKNRSIKSEYASYDPEIDSNAFVETQIESVEMLSMVPPSSSPPPLPLPLNIETNVNKIHLTMETTSIHHPTHGRRTTTKPLHYNTKLRRSTAQPLLRSWFAWLRPKKNTAFYSPPFEHPTKGVKIQMGTNESPNGVRSRCITIEAAADTSTVAVKFADNNNMSSNDDEDICNDSLQNVDSVDELAAYMNEIRAREKR